MEHCPCGTNKFYSDCCGAFIAGERFPATPEELMRSRYTAYTEANINYITKTMKPPALNNFDEMAAEIWAKRVEWLKLEVIETSINDTKTIGFVEFLASFNDNKKRHAIHELSEFHLINNQWFYVDGKAPKQRPPLPVSKVGRNEDCICGSGKKYKKCCGSV